MKYITKGRGYLVKNEKYEKGGSLPMYKGKCSIDDKTFYIGAWVKEKENGEKILSLTYSVQDEDEPMKSNQEDMDWI
jgi:ATP-dependent DNA ligase